MAVAIHPLTAELINCEAIVAATTIATTAVHDNVTLALSHVGDNGADSFPLGETS